MFGMTAQGARPSTRLVADPKEDAALLATLDNASAPFRHRLPRGMFGAQPSVNAILTDPNRRPSERDAALANGTGDPIEALNASNGLPDSGQEDAPTFEPARAMGTLRSAVRPQAEQARSFDYDAAMQALAPAAEKPSTLKQIAGIVGPALMAMSGNEAGANAMIQHMAQRRLKLDERQREALATIAEWKHEDWAREHGAELRAANPRVIGRDLVRYNPATDAVDELYDGEEDFELYAETLGLEPGSPEYFDAVEDYVLRSNGPSAHARDLELDDYRTGNRVEVEGVRQSNRIGLEGVRQRNRVTTRQTPTYRDLNPPAPRGGGGSRIVTVSSVEEASKLPSGTTFKTPDGRVKVRP